MQRMVAMLFALDDINSKMKLLPSATLGAQILDTWCVFARPLPGGVEWRRRHAMT